MKPQRKEIPKVISGLTAQQAMDVTRNFLYWYAEFLRKHEPQATNTLGSINTVIDSFPETIEEL